MSTNPTDIATTTTKPKKDWRTLRDQADVMAVGMEIGLALLAGWYIGHLFDGHFETAPWGQAFFFVAGIGAAVKGVVRAVKQAKKVMMRPEPGQAMATKLAAAARARDGGDRPTELTP